MKLNKRTQIISSITVGAAVLLLSQSVNAVIYTPHGFYVTGGVDYGRMEIEKLQPTEGLTLEKKYKTLSHYGLGYTVGFGYGLENYPFRFELEYTKRPDLEFDASPVFTPSMFTKIESKFINKTYMLNGYFDIPASKYIVPYLKLGVGYANNEVDYTVNTTTKITGDYKNTGFAWQVGIGMRIKFTNNVFCNLAVQHVELGDAQWGPWKNGTPITIKSDSVSSNEALLTFSIFFGDQMPPPPPPTLINDE